MFEDVAAFEPEVAGEQMVGSDMGAERRLRLGDGIAGRLADHFDVEIFAALVPAIEVGIDGDALPGALVGEIVEDRRVEAAGSREGEEQADQRDGAERPAGRKAAEVVRPVERNGRDGARRRGRGVVQRQAEAAAGALQPAQRPAQLEGDAFRLQRRAGGGIEMGEALGRAGELGVGRAGRRRVEEAAREIAQRGVLADPEHPLLGQLDVDLGGRDAVEALHIGFEPGAVQQVAADPVAGEFPRIGHPALENPREGRRAEDPRHAERSGGDDVVADRDRIGGDLPLRIEPAPARLDRHIALQQLREMAEQREIVLEDEAADVERVAARGKVDVVAAEMAIFVGDQHALRPLRDEDRRRDEAGDAGAEHDGVEGGLAALRQRRRAGRVLQPVPPSWASRKTCVRCGHRCLPA
ncbi:MAG: hypothetical protein QM722_00605 [Piscinibacter sp.]